MPRYEFGTRLRYKLTLASGMLECLCFAGVVFGFASLMFVLKDDGYFSQLCVSVPGTNGTLTSTGEQLWSSGWRRDLVAGMLFRVSLLGKLVSLNLLFQKRKKDPILTKKQAHLSLKKNRTNTEKNTNTKKICQIKML